MIELNKIYVHLEVEPLLEVHVAAAGLEVGLQVRLPTLAKPLVGNIFRLIFVIMLYSYLHLGPGSKEYSRRGHVHGPYV